MKYFEKDGKYNFVDENNVLVGYSSDGNCCEEFGFVISEKPEIVWFDKNGNDHQFIGKVFISPFCHNFDVSSTEDILRLECYNFDVDYFKELQVGYGDISENTSCVQFKLKQSFRNEVVGEIFLTLYNYQNGYYSHGFNMDVGGKTIRSGEI